MSFHSYNHGLVSSAKGAALQFAVVSNLDIAPAADAECDVSDFASNFVESVIHSATGVLDVQLRQPFPADLHCIPSISASAATQDLIHARYVDGSYDATDGTFQVVLTNDDDAGAGVAVAGGAANELVLLMICQRYTTLA
jgi:hypothetical protein